MLCGTGGGSGQPSAIRVSVLVLCGTGGGSGQPSTIKVLVVVPGGTGGGKGQPSATTGLLTLYLPLPPAGSRMKTARDTHTDRITSFFMDEPSWLCTMRASRPTRGQNSKMF